MGAGDEAQGEVEEQNIFNWKYSPTQFGADGLGQYSDKFTKYWAEVTKQLAKAIKYSAKVTKYSKYWIIR